MTDFETALNVLYAFRDSAREAAGHLAPFVRGGTADANTLAEWRMENALDQKFTQAIEMILKCTEEEDDGDYEPSLPDDYYADGEALASIGWGTDEDYGYYGDSDY